MMQIPKIIHQVWSGIEEPLPNDYREFGNTWIQCHPNWQYEFWDNQRMNEFIKTHYPEYWDAYNLFPHNIQRWDVIRYLILYKMGGMYVDFDYECIKPFDNLLVNKLCCFSSEPKEHSNIFRSGGIYFNNALMASIPNHGFMNLIIQRAFDEVDKKQMYSNKMMEVLNTTGPFLLSNLYNELVSKDDIYIIPADIVSPLTKMDVERYLKNKGDLNFECYLERKLKSAYAVHYFFGGWL